MDWNNKMKKMGHRSINQNANLFWRLDVPMIAELTSTCLCPELLIIWTVAPPWVATVPAENADLVDCRIGLKIKTKWIVSVTALPIKKYWMTHLLQSSLAPWCLLSGGSSHGIKETCGRVDRLDRILFWEIDRSIGRWWRRESKFGNWDARSRSTQVTQVTSGRER
jgi:hypothetical protein